MPKSGGGGTAVPTYRAHYCNNKKVQDGRERRDIQTKPRKTDRRIDRLNIEPENARGGCEGYHAGSGDHESRHSFFRWPFITLLNRHAGRRVYFTTTPLTRACISTSSKYDNLESTKFFLITVMVPLAIDPALPPLRRTLPPPPLALHRALFLEKCPPCRCTTFGAGSGQRRLRSGLF